MTFDSLTAEDLLAKIPAAEDDRWEFKSATYLEPAKKGELKKELGKQVSAFANSGGGHLVFGISKCRQLEECLLSVGRESMKDYLSTLVEACVEHPLRDFNIHQILFANNAAKAVFVVAVGDSAAAPHQAKDERNYYYRIDGHSKPAPHFHLELLRNRYTKSVVEIDDVKVAVADAEVDDNGLARLYVDVRVLISNRSMLAATDYGVLVRAPKDDMTWKGDLYLCDGTCYHGQNGVILPHEHRSINFRVIAEAPSAMSPAQTYKKLLEHLIAEFRPVSQNYVGQVVRFSIDSNAALSVHTREAERKLVARIRQKDNR